MARSCSEFQASQRLRRPCRAQCTRIAHTRITTGMCPRRDRLPIGTSGRTSHGDAADYDVYSIYPIHLLNFFISKIKQRKSFVYPDPTIWRKSQSRRTQSSTILVSSMLKTVCGIVEESLRTNGTPFELSNVHFRFVVRLFHLFRCLYTYRYKI